ncbi:CpaF family protein, partial [Vibrio alginolyticus]|nr:CpaF family protein [Vibrio alginolyticus]
ILFISEIVGLEGDSVVMEDIFRFENNGVGDEGKISGEFRTPGLSKRSVIYERAKFFGLDGALQELFS